MTYSINQSLFLWINHASSALPDWFWASLTITGHTSVVFALLAPLLLPRFAGKGGQVVITALLVCAVLGGLVATLFKESLQIPRPPAILSADAFRLIGHKLELVSFPSGHTLTAFAVATLLIGGFQLQGWRLLGILVLASLIGLSRIAVGAHWPFDVLGGAIFGAICGYLSVIAAKSLHNNWPWLLSCAYLLFQIALLWLVSASLWWTAMGYPDAQIWQYLIAAFGLIMTSLAAILHLTSRK
jgi:membrane-associated phospholipid phosphatase